MESIIPILVVFLILFLIFWCVGKLVADGTVRSVIGIILAIIFLLFALKKLGLGGSLGI